MKRRHLLAILALSTGSLSGLTSSAHAYGAMAILPTIGMLPIPNLVNCNVGLQPAAGGEASFSAFRIQSKSAAILGGHASKLELMIRNQAGTGALIQTSATLPTNQTGESLAPAAGSTVCVGVTAQHAEKSLFAPVLNRSRLGPDDFLSSRRLPVQKTGFNSAWSRVSAAGLPRRVARRMFESSARLTGQAKLMLANGWANSNIRYVDDRQLYGKADYWANAGTTLRRGAGDCEDIAILKMQILAAMGVSRSDMNLTVARDLVRNADHAVLVVKSEGKYWLLDNATNKVLDASASQDYRPIMSFSEHRIWLHGY